MKKFYYIAIAATMLSAFTSCKKEVSPVSENEQPALRTITASFENAETRSTLGANDKPLWAEGDQIRLLDDSSYEIITLTSSMINGSSVTFPTSLTGTTLYAVYPAAANSQTKFANGNLRVTIPKKQDGTFASANICVAKGDGADNLVFNNATAVLEFNQTASATGVVSVDVATVNDTGIAGTLEVTFGSDNKIATSELTTDHAVTYKVIETDIAATAKDKYYVAVAAFTDDVDITYHTPIREVKERYLGRTTERNTIYTVSVPTGGYELSTIEMGGIKWAKCNLGATTIAGSLETCAGEYYQWGATDKLYNSKTWNETDSLFTFSWKDGVETKGGFSDANNTYSGTDSVLPPANDIVNLTLGGNWRMPTNDEFQNLIGACVDSFVGTIPVLESAITEKGIYWLNADQDIIPFYAGVAGVLFVDGSENELFLPATGFFDGLSVGDFGFLKSSKPKGAGFYWLSTLDDSDGGDMVMMGYDMSNYNVASVGFGFRSYGCSIRPVLGE